MVQFSGVIHNADSVKVIVPYVTITNISNHTCYLVGWPGVSAVNSNLKQLGAAAVRDATIPRQVVDLAPGGTAHATLAWVDAVVFNPGCGRVTASFLNVYPPDQRGGRTASHECPSSCCAASVSSAANDDLVACVPGPVSKSSSWRMWPAWSMMNA